MMCLGLLSTFIDGVGKKVAKLDEEKDHLWFWIVHFCPHVATLNYHRPDVFSCYRTAWKTWRSSVLRSAKLKHAHTSGLNDNSICANSYFNMFTLSSKTFKDGQRSYTEGWPVRRSLLETPENTAVSLCCGSPWQAGWNTLTAYPTMSNMFTLELILFLFHAVTCPGQ